MKTQLFPDGFNKKIVALYYKTRKYYHYHVKDIGIYILFSFIFLLLSILMYIVIVLLNKDIELGKISFKISFILSAFFGIATIVSLIISRMVLRLIKKTINNYIEAGKTLEREIIKNTITTIFVLSENPAFLQVVSPELLQKWRDSLKGNLKSKTFIRAVFAYVQREKLIGNKFPKWGEKLGLNQSGIQDMIEAFLNSHTFHLSIDPEFNFRVYLVPLMTSGIPFYIAVADNDGKSMFCKSEELDEDVRKWKLRGFSSSDPSISLGLNDVFLKILQLNGSVYIYRCNNNNCKGYVYLYDRTSKEFIKFKDNCDNNQTSIYLFDHDLLRMNINNWPTHIIKDKLNNEKEVIDLSKTPRIICPQCKGININNHLKLTHELEELKKIDSQLIISNNEIKKIIGHELPSFLKDSQPYNIGKLLFWIVTGEEWND